jgi:hypothetical protein
MFASILSSVTPATFTLAGGGQSSETTFEVGAEESRSGIRGWPDLSGCFPKFDFGDFPSNEDVGRNLCAKDNNRGPCEPVKPWMVADSVTTLCY